MWMVVITLSEFTCCIGLANTMLILPKEKSDFFQYRDAIGIFKLNVVRRA